MEFSTAWNSSTQPRKQRKYRFNAPLHVKQKFMHVHLSPELRQKFGVRAVQVRKGDTVKVLRGGFKKKEGKVNKVLLKEEKVYVDGVDLAKKDGSKLPRALHPSNLMIVAVTADKKRKLEAKK